MNQVYILREKMSKLELALHEDRATEDMVEEYKAMKEELENMFFKVHGALEMDIACGWIEQLHKKEICWDDIKDMYNEAWRKVEAAFP